VFTYLTAPSAREIITTHPRRLTGQAVNKNRRYLIRLTDDRSAL